MNLFHYPTRANAKSCDQNWLSPILMEGGSVDMVWVSKTSRRGVVHDFLQRFKRYICSTSCKSLLGLQLCRNCKIWPAVHFKMVLVLYGFLSRMCPGRFFCFLEKEGQIDSSWTAAGFCVLTRIPHCMSLRCFYSKTQECFVMAFQQILKRFNDISSKLNCREKMSAGNWQGAECHGMLPIALPDNYLYWGDERPKYWLWRWTTTMN